MAHPCTCAAHENLSWDITDHQAPFPCISAEENEKYQDEKLTRVAAIFPQSRLPFRCWSVCRRYCTTLTCRCDNGMTCEFQHERLFLVVGECFAAVTLGALRKPSPGLLRVCIKHMGGHAQGRGRGSSLSILGKPHKSPNLLQVIYTCPLES